MGERFNNRWRPLSFFSPLLQENKRMKQCLEEELKSRKDLEKLVRRLLKQTDESLREETGRRSSVLAWSLSPTRESLQPLALSLPRSFDGDHACFASSLCFFLRKRQKKKKKHPAAAPAVFSSSQKPILHAVRGRWRFAPKRSFPKVTKTCPGLLRLHFVLKNTLLARDGSPLRVKVAECKTFRGNAGGKKKNKTPVAPSVLFSVLKPAS